MPEFMTTPHARMSFRSITIIELAETISFATAICLSPRNLLRSSFFIIYVVKTKALISCEVS